MTSTTTTPTTPAVELPSRSTDQRPTRVRYVVMAFICVLAFLTYFDRVCIMRAQGDIERDLHITDEQMGIIFSVFWFSYALFEIPTGWLGDRFGARSTLTRIVLAWSVFTALSGSATGFVSLFMYRFMFGVGEAGAFPNMARVQWRWLPPTAQGRASGMIWLVARWGGAFAPLLFGTVLRGLDSHAFHHFLASVPLLASLNSVPTWRLAFGVCGLVGLVWIVLFFPWFRDSPADKRSVNAAELRLIRGGRAVEARNARPRYDWQVWRKLLTSRNLWGLSMYYAFGSFCWSFFVSWVPKFLKQVHHLDYGKSELMSGLPLLFGGIACLMGGTLSDWMIRLTGRRRLGRALLPILGRLVAAAMILAAGHASSAHLAIFFMCVCMLAHDMGQGPTWASVVEIGGDYAGTAAGFVNTVTNLGGNVLQPILGAMIFTKYGWNALFVVFALIYFVSAAMWLFIDPQRKFYESETPAGGFPVVRDATAKARSREDRREGNA